MEGVRGPPLKLSILFHLLSATARGIMGPTTIRSRGPRHGNLTTAVGERALINLTFFECHGFHLLSLIFI